MNIETKVYDIQPAGFSPKVEVAATYVIVNGKVLLLKLADNKPEAGKWGVPAGKLEVGELPENGARRELFEETGIRIDATLTLIGPLYIRKPGIDYVYHRFGVTLRDFPEVQLSNEHCSHTWVSKEEAEHLPLMAGGKQALDGCYRFFLQTLNNSLSYFF